ncbi:MAG: NAD-binding protein [Rhodocyclaceae bacterium]|nr:NAD-binding protein [Rhodocyclaceae bacterium]
MNSVFFLVLRRMRAPLIVLIVIYAVSVLGLTLAPGVDANGQPAPPLSFFHAFYFVSYTATTIGFGEIPTAFSDAQRLWVTICIYLTVIGWSYSILTLLALFQDKGFQNTLVAGRFARRVRNIRESFHLICGCGETGSLVCHAMDRLGRKFVIVEKDELRVQELDLEDFKTDTPTLAADARQPATLVLAGLRHPKCRAVLALTDDEETNLAVSIATRLLNPDIPVLARARSPLVAANMASFGTDHIIDPFERFAEYLALGVAAPERFRLIEILTGLPGADLPGPHRPPAGHWIVCGYGRFGRAVVRHLAPAGIGIAVIDPEPPEPDGLNTVRGLGTDAATLVAAGIREAVGIVAGSDNDVNNLSIAVTANELNPRLFVVTRQNQAANAALFDAFRSDFNMVPSRIVAQECLAILTTPLLTRFLGLVRGWDEDRCRDLAGQLQDLDGGRVPEIWGVRLNAGEAPAAHRALMAETGIRLGDLLRDNAAREDRLPILPLLLERGGEALPMPSGAESLAPGDHLLLAGHSGIRRRLDLTLQNANVLDYAVRGREGRGGWIWQKLFPGGAAR